MRPRPAVLLLNLVLVSAVLVLDVPAGRQVRPLHAGDDVSFNDECSAKTFLFGVQASLRNASKKSDIKLVPLQQCPDKCKHDVRCGAENLTKQATWVWKCLGEQQLLVVSKDDQAGAAATADCFVMLSCNYLAQSELTSLCTCSNSHK